MPKYKGKEINTKPSEGMVSEAGVVWNGERSMVAAALRLVLREQEISATAKSYHSIL